MHGRKQCCCITPAKQAVFDLSEAVGVIPTDNFDATKLKLTAYFTPRRNEEYEVFTFRQTQQKSGETIDQFHARLQQMSKNCNFEDKIREIKSQIIQKCLMHTIRDKGLSEVNITLPQLLTYGRTLEATVQQAKSISALLEAGAEVVYIVTTRWLVPDMTSHTTSRTRVNHRIGGVQNRVLDVGDNLTTG